MRIFVTLAILVALLFSGILKPADVHAGAGDAILVLAVLGGTAYGTYKWSQKYEIKEKAAVEIRDGKVKFQRPTLQIESSEEGFLFAKEDRYNLGIVNINF